MPESERPAIGTLVPDFSLPATGGRTFRLDAQRGKKLVLYFYPRDATPGCTTEAHDFRDIHLAFAESNCIVAGVSRDTLASHEKFSKMLGLPFDLLADTDETVCNLFGVIKEKNMYGKRVRGIERSTFLIDTAGVLRQEWRGVKVPGHVDAVLSAAKSL